MLGKAKTIQVLALSLLALAANTSTLRAEGADEKFYRAYYLERARGDRSSAADLYSQVVADNRVDTGLKSEAQARLAACREELACTDFARLMPADTLFYAEIKQPGDQLTRLLEQLGLLAGAGTSAGEDGNRVAVSPALVKELLGIRGAAVAVTGFDPIKQMPSGVVIFHPGDVGVIRGLIETGLPIGGAPVKAIRGYPTYEIEGKVTVTLTSRLVLVSTQRPQIINVLRRMDGEESSSLATNQALADALKDRDDSLLFFCLNAKPVMPMLNGLMGIAGSQNQELAVAQAVLDLNSIQSLVGHAGVSDEGIFFDMALRLDEGHHNLVYNFFRSARINPETVKSIPDGTAAFLVTALNEKGAKYGTLASTGGDPQVVTAMDIGREIFANITGLAVFALPPTDAAAPSGPPVPDVAAVVSVNDPAKSKALWSTVLGVASLACGATSIEGAEVEIDGVTATSYRMPEGVTIYYATVGHNVVISPSQSAIARSIQATRTGRSVLDDAVYANNIGRLNENTTLGVFAHPGRCAKIAKRFMSPDEVAEMEPFLAPLADTVVSLVVDHSDQVFRFAGMVSGMPNLGPIISRAIEREHEHQETNAKLSKAMRGRDWNRALEIIDAQMVDEPGSTKLLRKKFQVLATGKQNADGARTCAETLLERWNGNATALNSFAWELLTKEQYAGAYADLARRMSLRSNEITNYKKWMFVDTLALAEFETGNLEAAVELERKCLDLCGDSAGRNEVETALARFEAALRGDKLVSDAGGVRRP